MTKPRQYLLQVKKGRDRHMGYVCKRYVKKPIPVEAVQVQKEMNEAPDWYFDAIKHNVIHRPNSNTGLSVITLEGVMFAPWGSYIIRGVHGELYPIREDIFNETYEEYEGDDHE